MDSSTGNDRGHNARWERIVSAEKHIDPNLKSENITLVDKDLKTAYEELFGDALDKYNQKQIRRDRKIESYYSKVKNDNKLNLAYKFVAQIGGHDSVGLNETRAKEALKEYMENFQKNNPHLYVTGLYLHADEAEGTFHLHGEFIPWGDGYKKGLSIQNSLDRALKQQGYETKTTQKNGRWASCQTQFEARQREILADIAREHGLNITLDKKENQHRYHMKTPEYKALMEELKIVRSNINKLKKEEQNLDKEINSLLKQADEIYSSVDNNILMEQQRAEIERHDKELRKKMKIMEKKYEEALNHVEASLKKGHSKETVLINKNSWESLKQEVLLLKTRFDTIAQKEASLEQEEANIFKVKRKTQDLFDDAVEMFEHAEEIVQKRALDMYENLLSSNGDDLMNSKIALKKKEEELRKREKLVAEKEYELFGNKSDKTASSEDCDLEVHEHALEHNSTI